MKNITDFETLVDFLEYFHDEETCRTHFAGIRFANGEYCPHCGHRKIYTFQGGKRYRCAGCKKDFTIVTGTVFGETKLPLKKWFIAIYLLTTTSKGISSIQLAKHVGVTQKTGWFMDHRLREAIKANKGQLFGSVEIDETYIGGKAKNMRLSKRQRIGGGTKGKICITGLVQRDGQLKAKVIKGSKGIQIPNLVFKTVEKGSTIYTDESRLYDVLPWKHFARHSVKHACKEYVNGDAHTNTIESFWALFKRGYHGVYHWMSKKHLQRYVDEFAFRWNARPGNQAEVFAKVVDGVARSEWLPYKELTA